MAARAETQPWGINTANPNDYSGEESDIVRKAQDLGEFLEGSPIGFINIDGVLPSARFGIMLKIRIGRIEGVDETKGTIITSAVFNLDNRVLNTLDQSVEAMSDEGKEKTAMIRKNLVVIIGAVYDAFEWPAPFNAREDN